MDPTSTPARRPATETVPRADAPGDDVVVAQGMVKTFGPVHALDGLDLRVRRGEVHGFLGPNGSGKSTTIRILLGLMRRSAGHVTLFGEDPWQHAARLHRRLAYVPGDVTLWPGLTGGECIDVLAQAHGGLRELVRADLVERFDLDPTRRSRDYSKGNRQKVALVAALATDVDLLVLDEPTSGLDPLMEAVFQDVVRERRAAGVTVLLSSHILAEVEALADRVSIIRRGRTVTSGSLPELRRHTRTSLHATTSSRPENLEGARGTADVVVQDATPSGEVGSGLVHDVRLTVDTAHLDAVLGLLHHAGVRSLTAAPPSLDELFRTAYSAGREQ